MNLFQGGPSPTPIWLKRSFYLGFCILLGLAAQGQNVEDDLAERLPAEVRKKFVPKVTPLPHEDRVLRSTLVDALPGRTSHHLIAAKLWATSGGVILDLDSPGLTLHYYAQGIEQMTLVDRLWEGLPRRADTMQDLIDHAISRSRTTAQPIAHLIIAGHAGLPGCSAFGGTIDDCTFRGNLSGYQRRQLARLRPYLARTAEIELRQCVTGSGKEGERLLTAIHEVTGASASSYLADFHFGDADNHPRVRVGGNGYEVVKPIK